MMIKYFCNVCEKEVKAKDMTIVLIKNGTEENKHTIHICNVCNEALKEEYNRLRNQRHEQSATGDVDTFAEKYYEKKVQSIEDKALPIVSPETVSMDEWVENEDIKSFMEKIPWANRLDESEFIQVCPYVRSNRNAKRYIVNLFINKYNISQISKILGIKYSQVYTFVNSVISHCKSKQVTQEERTNIMNLLRVKWFVRDISGDQNIDLDKVVSVLIEYAL